MRSWILGLVCLCLCACDSGDDPGADAETPDGTAMTPDSAAADAETESCDLPRSEDCGLDPYLEGWWEGTCTGSTEGGEMETYALVFEVRPSGYSTSGPIYERHSIGEGEWVGYHSFGHLITADGDEVSSPYNAQTDNFNVCVSETCTVDPAANLVFTLITEQDAMFTPTGTVPRGYLFAGARAGMATAERVADPPHPAGQEVSAQIHGPVIDGERVEGPCAWQTTHIEYRESSYRPDPPVIRTGTGMVRWTRCPESNSSLERHARTECRPAN